MEPIWSCSEWGFPGPPITRGTGELLPRRFTLTPGPFPHLRGEARGGLFSVALSFPSPGLRVTEHPALRSSDFPPAAARTAAGDRPAGSNAQAKSTACGDGTQPSPSWPLTSRVGGGGTVPCGRQLRARPELVHPYARSAQLALRAQTVRFAPAGPLQGGRSGSLALRHAPARHRLAATLPVFLPEQNQRGGWGMPEGRCAEPPSSPTWWPGRSRRDEGSLFEPKASYETSSPGRHAG